MSEQQEATSATADVVRKGGAAVLVVIMALAFAGMGLFMWNMGRDMGTMTESVVQMGLDVGRMSRNMEGMAGNMNQMAKSMVEGQARMGDDFSRVRIGMESMTHN
ncbi:MAG TPA: LPXTG cell wall surface anchor family - like protein, partial [Gammaproteobacteria bacterium]|nr:LPXTG cell wall surface anchor family - like protein [Gammaproteobacteria bacterium]